MGDAQNPQSRSHLTPYAVHRAGQGSAWRLAEDLPMVVSRRAISTEIVNNPVKKARVGPKRDFQSSVSTICTSPQQSTFASGFSSEGAARFRHARRKNARCRRGNGRRACR
jgi:hypothetical protein